MKSDILFCIVLCQYLLTATVLARKKSFGVRQVPVNVNSIETEESEANSTALAPKIGFNFAMAGSMSYGENGQSSSKASSTGTMVGIRNEETQSYTPIRNDIQQSSSRYKSGLNAPNSWAFAYSQGQPGNVDGNAGSGYSGKQGSVYTYKASLNGAYKINDKLTLLSNLPHLS